MSDEPKKGFFDRIKDVAEKAVDAAAEVGSTALNTAGEFGSSALKSTGKAVDGTLDVIKDGAGVVASKAGAVAGEFDAARQAVLMRDQIEKADLIVARIDGKVVVLKSVAEPVIDPGKALAVMAANMLTDAPGAV
jgi:hypothetical protein